MRPRNAPPLERLLPGMGLGQVARHVEDLKLIPCGGGDWRTAGLAFRGGLETTKPSFLGMPFGRTGSGASPKGRGGSSGTVPCSRRSLCGRRFSQVINPANEAGWMKAAWFRKKKKNAPARRPFRFMITKLQANKSAGLTAIFCTEVQRPVPINH